jgi:hypothetical protein
MGEKNKTIWAIVLFVAGNLVAVGGLFLLITFSLAVVREFLHSFAFLTKEYVFSSLGMEFYLGPLKGILAGYIPVTALLLIISETLVHRQDRTVQTVPGILAVCLLGLLLLNAILWTTDFYRMQMQVGEPYLLVGILSLAVYSLGGCAMMLFALFRRPVYAITSIIVPILASVPLAAYAWQYPSAHPGWEALPVSYPLLGRLVLYLAVVLGVNLILFFLVRISKMERRPWKYALVSCSVTWYLFFFFMAVSVLLPFHLLMAKIGDSKIPHPSVPIVRTAFYVLWGVIIVVQVIRFFRRRTRSRSQKRIAESC